MEITCQKCRRTTELPVCESCGIVAPVPTVVSYFELFGLQLRPVILEEDLKEAHLKLSQKVHPDRFQGRPRDELELAVQWSSLINKAYATLKDPTERIPYLVGLETGKDPKLARTAAVSRWTLSLFNNVRQACEAADALITKKISSRIVAAALLEQRQRHADSLQGLKDLVAKMRERTIDDLKKIDEHWPEATPDKRGALVKLLSKIGGDLAYLAKMDSLLEERLLQLSI